MTDITQGDGEDTAIDRSDLSNMKSGDINFNGVSFMDDLGVFPLKFSPTVAPNISDVQEDIPAKYGSKFEGTDYQGKVLNIPIAILNMGNDYGKFTDTIRALSNVLISSDPRDIGDEFPLVYGVNPDITYYGRFTSIGNPNYAYGDDKLDCTIDLTFEMSDPRAYLPLVELPIDNRANRSDNLVQNSNQTATIDAAQASADNYPISCNLAQDISGQNIIVSLGVTVSNFVSGSGSTDVTYIDVKDGWDTGNWATLFGNGKKIPIAGNGYYALTGGIITKSALSSGSNRVEIECRNFAGTIQAQLKIAVVDDFDSLPDMNWSPAAGETGYYKYTSGYDVTVDGTAPADPIVSIIPKRDLNYVGYIVNNQHFAVGSDQEEIQSDVQDKYTNVLSDNADTTAPWTNDSSAISPITTAVKFTPQGSYASSDDGSSVLHVGKDSKGNFDFGKVVHDGWYGPLLRYEGLTQSLQDFKVSVMIHHKKYMEVTRGDTDIHNGRAMGDVEFLLLDPNGRTIGRCAIKDQSGGRVPYCYFQVGTAGTNFIGNSYHHDLYVGKGNGFQNGPDKTFKITLSTTTKNVKEKKVKYVKKSKRRKKKTYVTVNKKVKIKNQVKVMNEDNLSSLTDGWLQFNLERVGKVFTWSIVQYDIKTGRPYRDKTKHLIKSGQYVDNAGKIQDRLGSFGVAFWKTAISEDIANPVIPYRNAYLSLTDLQVWKVNNIQPKKPVVVCKKGQEIVFNSTLNRVTVDGKLVYPEWTTDYPKLRPGVTNTLYYVGDIDDAQINVDYYPRLK